MGVSSKQRPPRLTEQQLSIANAFHAEALASLITKPGSRADRSVRPTEHFRLKGLTEKSRQVVVDALVTRKVFLRTIANGPDGPRAEFRFPSSLAHTKPSNEVVLLAVASVMRAHVRWSKGDAAEKWGVQKADVSNALKKVDRSLLGRASEFDASEIVDAPGAWLTASSSDDAGSLGQVLPSVSLK